MLFFPILLFGVFLMALPQISNACTITNPAPSTDVSQYGEPRPGRVHRGVDIFMKMCVAVPNQTIGGQPCGIIPNGGSPLHKTGGYGLYTRYNCGPRVEVRYAHLNGWSNGLPANGRSGAARPTPPHVHYEVLIDRVKVDPRCVWGQETRSGSCCQGLGANCGIGSAPANMCDNAVLDKLKKNAFSQYSNLQKGLVSSMSVQPGVSASSFPSQSPEVDLPGCPESSKDDPDKPQDPKDHTHEHDGVDNLEANPQFVEGSQNPLLTPTTPSPTDPPPIIPAPPPAPPVPGNPGGDAILVPKVNDSNAQVSGCAVDTWTAMVNQAVMETRREDIVNKRFIVKADSVLDYGCFDKNIEVAKQSLGPIFTETQKWAALPVDLIGKIVMVQRSHGSQALDNALDSVVKGAAQSYRNLQFNHPALSGSVPVSGGSSGNCDLMGKVWQAAKCKNFSEEKVFDKNTNLKIFYRFEDLRDFEPREFPANMKCDG